MSGERIDESKGEEKMEIREVGKYLTRCQLIKRSSCPSFYYRYSLTIDTIL